MTKTYAESRGRKPFDWNEFLERGIAGTLTYKEKIEGNDLVWSYVTCACGNLCDAIPRDSQGDPKDRQLSSLGIEFADFVEEGLYENAREILNQIEDRSTEILTEMGLCPANPTPAS